MENAITLPTVNLNGTSAEDLTEKLETALSAIRELRTALADCNPNGRDYPSEAEWKKARDEHCARDASLSSIQKELGAIHESVVEQAESRRRR